MTGLSPMTPELMAKAINVALSVRRNSWIPKERKFDISNAQAVKCTCEVLGISHHWEIFIYYAIYLPTRSLEEWAEQMVYKEGETSWPYDKERRLP